MARKGENIYKRKDGRWEGRYITGRKPDGKPHFSSIYGKQYTEVKQRLILLKAQNNTEEAACVIYGNGSLKDWGDYWLESLEKPYIRPGTYAGYRRNLDNHIYPHLGQIEIRRLTTEQIQTAVNEMQKGLAPSTLHGICRLLKSILHAAMEEQVIKKNPYYHIKLPKIQKRQPRVLTRKEQEKLEQKIWETGDLEYILCLYTGLRVGEVCALCWEDVNLENSCLYVRRSVQRLSIPSSKKKSRLSLEYPKSDCSVREIPLPAFLAAILKEKKERQQGMPGDFLFPGRNRGCQDPRNMQQKMGKLCEELGISGVHMHTLRHTFATRCLESGISYEVLSEFLGHSSPQITLRCYVHCTPQTRRESMDRLCPQVPVLYEPSKMVCR